jgi:hypothetical protein
VILLAKIRVLQMICALATLTQWACLLGEQVLAERLYQATAFYWLVGARLPFQDLLINRSIVNCEI